MWGHVQDDMCVAMASPESSRWDKQDQNKTQIMHKIKVFTLPHEFQRIPTFPSEFHGIPMESIWLEPQPFWVPIPWKFQQNPMESTGISWNPGASQNGFHWNPLESAGNDWNPEILTHSNHFQQIPVDSHWNAMIAAVIIFNKKDTWSRIEPMAPGKSCAS